VTPTQALVPDPARGRVYTAKRLVRSTDVTQAGRLRLDALARYLQAVAEDDLADSGLLAPPAWLVRRCAVIARGFPQMGERITLRTFCSGTGPRWAERTTTIAGATGDLLQATAVWAAVDRASGRPVAPGEAFLRVYGESAQGRAVSARLSHPRHRLRHGPPRQQRDSLGRRRGSAGRPGSAAGAGRGGVSPGDDRRLHATPGNWNPRRRGHAVAARRTPPARLRAPDAVIAWRHGPG
jgi:Acyl-ACP thioesterase